MKPVEPDREYPYPKLVDPDRKYPYPKLVEPGREERATRVETPGTRTTNPTPKSPDKVTMVSTRPTRYRSQISSTNFATSNRLSRTATKKQSLSKPQL